MLRVEEIHFYREEHINWFSNIKCLALKTYMSKLHKLSMFYLGIHIYTHIYSTKTINEKRYKKFERK